MKRTIIVSLVLVCVACCAHVWLLEGIDGLVASYAFEDSSEFSPGYTDAAFRSIRSGMNAQAVIERLGEPLHRSSDVWFYSQSTHDSHFHSRLVRFHQDVVVDTFAEFYVD